MNQKELINLITQYENTEKQYITQQLITLMYKEKFHIQKLQSILNCSYHVVASYLKLQYGNKISLKYLLMIAEYYHIDVKYFLK